MDIAETEKGEKGKKEKKTFLRLLDEMKTGKMLVWISFCYIFLTTPHTIDQFLYVVYKGITYGLLQSFTQNLTGDKVWNQKFDGTREILRGGCYLFQTCNYSLNFYFYCAINTDIRKHTVAYFQKIRYRFL